MEIVINRWVKLLIYQQVDPTRLSSKLFSGKLRVEDGGTNIFTFTCLTPQEIIDKINNIYYYKGDFVKNRIIKKIEKYTNN